jgi:hypothetical protein
MNNINGSKPNSSEDKIVKVNGNVTDPKPEPDLESRDPYLIGLLDPKFCYYSSGSRSGSLLFIKDFQKIPDIL